jgi:hypothetical protein
MTIQIEALPKAVLHAWGTEVAEDFVTWLETRLSEISLSTNVQISAMVARRKINVLMLERVSNLLLANEPALIQLPDKKWVWQVPIDLTCSSSGRIGCVGKIDVDAQYGEVRYSEKLLAEIAHNAEQLVQSS